jgi:hypothetical protein
MCYRVKMEYFLGGFLSIDVFIFWGTNAASFF